MSFPGYDERAPTLGSRMRLVGPEGLLARLMAQDWLKGMRDHSQVLSIAPVPALARHRTLRRVQAKSSPERLRRRLMKRQGLDEAQVLERIPDAAAERLALPFVVLGSASTGQSFRLFLRQGPLEPEPRPGRFSAYGLSTTATVPHFCPFFPRRAQVLETSGTCTWPSAKGPKAGKFFNNLDLDFEGACELPDRQLRKSTVSMSELITGELPDRQLRKRFSQQKLRRKECSSRDLT